MAYASLDEVDPVGVDLDPYTFMCFLTKDVVCSPRWKKAFRRMRPWKSVVVSVGATKVSATARRALRIASSRVAP
jgi:hypothetical protein